MMHTVWPLVTLSPSWTKGGSPGAGARYMVPGSRWGVGVVGGCGCVGRGGGGDGKGPEGKVSVHRANHYAVYEWITHKHAPGEY
jgi:hypothetical protein